MKPSWILIGFAAVALAFLALSGRLFAPSPTDVAADHLTQAEHAAERLEATLSERSGDFEDEMQGEVSTAYDTTVFHYREAYSIKPSAAILVRLGRVQLAVGHIDEARRSFVEALTKWPGTPAAYAGLGDALFAFGDYRGAIENYRNALWWQANGVPDPTLHAMDVRLSLAESFATLHLPEAAIEEYESVLAARPDDAVALTGLFGVLVEKRRWDEALAVLGRLREATADEVAVVALLQNLVSTHPEIELPDWAAALTGPLPAVP